MPGIVIMPSHAGAWPKLKGRKLQPASTTGKVQTMTRRTVLLEALASTPNDISRLIRPLEGAGWDWVADGDTPSPWHIIAHLITTEKIYQDHISRILERDISDSLPGFQANSSQESHIPIGQLGRDFQQARGQTLQTLQAIGPGDWQRAAHLEPHGRISLRFLMQRLVEHDIEQTGRLVEAIHFRHVVHNNSGFSQ